MEAEKKTIIDPKYEPYKKPDNKDNQEKFLELFQEDQERNLEI